MRGRIPSGRTQVITDIENLGVPWAGGPIVHGIGDLVRSVLQAGAEMHFCVGVDKSRSFDAGREFPGARILGGVGPSGADRALVDDFDVHHVAHRYDGLVLASGDHEFTEVAVSAREAGLRVVVLSWRERLSRQLAHAVDHVLYLDDFAGVGPAQFMVGSPGVPPADSVDPGMAA